MRRLFSSLSSSASVSIRLEQRRLKPLINLSYLSRFQSLRSLSLSPPLTPTSTPPEQTETQPSTQTPSINFSDVPGVQTEGEKYAMVYTCKVCNTRSVKKISKQGYHHGCVLVRCPGCKNLHLIADHLGIFEDKGWTVESYLAEHNESVKRVVDDDVLELTRTDILGSPKEEKSN